MLLGERGLVCLVELDRKEEGKKGGIERRNTTTEGERAIQNNLFGSSKERGRKESKGNLGFDCTTQSGKECLMTN